MNVEKLRASDFPGIDEAKFNEWKALRLKEERWQRIVGYIALPLFLVLYEIVKSRKWTWQGWDVDWLQVYMIFVLIFFAVYGGFLDIKTRRTRRLGKELKMSARLRAKKKGRAFTG